MRGIVPPWREAAIARPASRHATVLLTASLAAVWFAGRFAAGWLTGRFAAAGFAATGLTGRFAVLWGFALLLSSAHCGDEGPARSIGKHG